jgi:hypothetical protein
VQRTVASLVVSAFVAFCSLVLFLSWEVFGEPRPARAQTTGTCPNAQFIDTFEGTGNQQTDTFNTTTDSFRVSYNVTGSEPNFPATLIIGVVDANANDPIMGSVGNATHEGNGRGETFVNAPPGSYFLDIVFFGGNYTIAVEQCEGGNPSRNPNPGGGAAAPIRDPVRDQYASKTQPGDVSNPRDVISRSGVRRIPPTGGPPYLLVGTLALLGVALIAGRGVLRR